ncbi:flagellar basal body-associated FliL family protein [Erythrobacter aureus]|uniref:SIMPL domain-containing protein n=1 Tax=Erythrobacter aureus TaxID=2182384 RepID=A0A345YJN6_9SPHN|nr:flagellar basal body-associated FliL family protein [Erythrobacter aureus]AXK44138.1 hypothetical protein DVR09_16940 [Erythrobacter aureus]
MRKRFLISVALLAALPLGGAQASEDRYDSSLAFVPMDMISIPIVDAGNVNGALRFKIVLEATDEEAAQHLSERLPILRSEALAVGAEFSRISAAPFLAVDAQELAESLDASLQEHSPEVERVLLVEVTARST